MFKKIDGDLIKGVVSSIFVKAGGVLSGFILNLFLAKHIGPVGVGAYFSALTLSTISSVFSRVGFDNILLRESAVTSDRSDPNILRRFGAIFVLVFFASVFVMLAALLIVYFFLADIYVNWDFTFPMLLSVPAFSIIILASEVIRGRKNILLSEALMGAGLPIMTLLVYSLFNLSDENSLNVSWAYLLSSCLLMLFSVHWSIGWSAFMASIPGFFSFSKTKHLVVEAAPLYVSSLLYQAAFPWLPFLILTFFSSAVEVGYFAISARLALLVGSLLIAFNSIAAPKIAAYYKIKDYASMEAMMQGASFFLTVAALPMVLGVFYFPDSVLKIFGEDFSGADGALFLLVLTQFFNMYFGASGYALIMCNCESEFKIAIVCAVGVLSSLLMILVPFYGALGAAVSVFLATLTSNMACAFFVYKKLNVVSFYSAGFLCQRGSGHD